MDADKESDLDLSPSLPITDHQSPTTSRKRDWTDRLVEFLIVAVIVAGALWFVGWSVLRNGWKGTVVDAYDGACIVPDEYGHEYLFLEQLQPNDLSVGDRVSVLDIGLHRFITKIN